MEIKKKKLSWASIDHRIDDLTEQIKQRDFSPDCIVSIGRGGMVPARILSDRLNIRDVYVISVHRYNGINKTLDKPTIKPFAQNIINKNVLLVDDIMDSGITVDCVLETLKINRARRILVASLLVRHDCKLPSFYSELVKNDDWIVFPWEKNEFGEDDG